MIDNTTNLNRTDRDRIIARHTPRRDEHEEILHKWDHVVEFWEVIRPAWWPILVTLILCVFVLGVGQIRDLLAAMPIDATDGVHHEGTAGVSGRFWTTFAACAVYAFIAWAFGRGLLSIRFPYTPCPFDPPAWHVVVRMLVSRGLGLALPISCSMSYYSLGMPREGLSYTILALVLFFAYWIFRRHIHDWIGDAFDLDEAEAEARTQGKPMSAEELQASYRADIMGDIDEALEEAEEAFDEAAREPDIQKRNLLLRQVAVLAETAGSAVRRAGSEFSEADLFDETMPQDFSPQMRRLLAGIMGFHLIAAVLFLFFPVALPQAIGAVAILFLGTAGWLSFGVFVFCYFTRYARLPPAILLFALWLAFTSQFNDNHDIARISEDATPDVSAPHIDDYLDDWLSARANVLPVQADDPEFPILVIAAEGGGARAAYWTGTVLSEINRAQPASGLLSQDHVLMVSGVSGGALGASAYGAALTVSDGDADRAYEDIIAFLKKDFLSPVTAGTLYHDFFTDMLPFPVRFADRARWLEGAWVKGWQETEPGSDIYAEDFRALWDAQQGRPQLGQLGAVPLLIYNTTSVRSGSTWTVAPVRFADAPGCDSRDFVDLITPDGKGLSLASAAHLSARFTGISPAGRIDLSGYPDCGEKDFDRFVDGAYFENSGADVASRLVRRFQSRLEAFCDERQCNPARMPIIPVAIVAERPVTVNPPRMSHETASVLVTVSNTRMARGQDSINRFADVTGVPVERIELSLGWDRSEEAAHCSLTPDAQLTSGAPNSANLTQRRVPLGWALSQSAVDHMCRDRLKDQVLDDIVARLEAR